MQRGAKRRHPLHERRVPDQHLAFGEPPQLVARLNNVFPRYGADMLKVLGIGEFTAGAAPILAEASVPIGTVPIYEALLEQDGIHLPHRGGRAALLAGPVGPDPRALGHGGDPTERRQRRLRQ